MVKPHIPKNMNPHTQHLNIKKLDKRGLPKKKLSYSFKTFIKNTVNEIKLGFQLLFRSSSEKTEPGINDSATKYNNEKIY
jgi:hypothetical protein